MKFGKKLLSVLLTVMMIVSMINVTAFADEESVAQIGTAKYNTLAEAVAKAQSGDTVEITVAGTYPIPTPIDGVTIDGTKAGGADSVIFDASKQTGQLAKTSGEITFKNVTFQFGSANYTGFQHPGNITFEECKLNGFITTYGDMTFKDCTLTSGPNQYAINFYGGSNFNLTNCHFYGVDKNVYIYQETLDGDKNVTFTNCDFHMSGSGDTKSAIMLNAPVDWAKHVYNVTINNCTAEGGMNKTAAADVAGNTNYQGIYGLKHIGGSGADSLINGTVTINGVQVYPEPVAQIGKINYSTLADAIANVKPDETITLLKNCSGNGISVPSGKNFTVDFKGFTYTIDGTTVGSTGTETNGFQLLKNSTITFKNGILTSDKAYILIQNYCNLTLDNMTLDGTNLKDTIPYTLSNNCGNVTIKDTTITAANNGVAFDVYGGFQNYDDVTVTVTGNSVINGKVEVARSKKTQNTNTNTNTLNINGGKINGDLAVTPNEKTVVTITGGVFSTRPDTAYVANDYAVMVNTDAATKAAYPFTVGKPSGNVNVAEVTAGKAKVESDVKVDTPKPNGGAVSAEEANAATAASTVAAGMTVTGTGLDIAATQVAQANTVKGSDATYKTETGATSTESLVAAFLNPPQPSDIAIVVQTYTDVKVADVTLNNNDQEKIQTITYDIQPMAQKIATTNATNIVTEGASQNAVKVGKPEKLTITEPVSMTIPLPDNFVDGNSQKYTSGATLYIKHVKEDGTTYIYQGTVTNVDPNYSVSFVNPNGFSSFTVTPTATTVASITRTGNTTMYFESLQDAVDEVENGETIKLEAAVTGTATVRRAVSFTLNESGKAFTGAINAGYNYSRSIAANVYTFTYSGYSAPVNTQTFSTDLDKITSVKVDGNTVNSKYYTVTGKNITLTEEFLNTLADGSHTFAAYGTINNAAKVATATFYITGNSANVTNPETGFGYIGIAAALAAIR